MEKDALVLGLEGIRRKITDTQAELTRLTKAESQFSKALRGIQDGELPLKPDGKRLKKGLTQKYILELLSQNSAMTTEAIILSLKQDKNIDIARTTVAMNLSRMQEKELIISDEDGRVWRIVKRDSLSNANTDDEDENPF